MRSLTILILVCTVLFLFSSCAWFGAGEEQKLSTVIEVPARVSADSSEYEQYTACVTQCSSCEINCLNSLYFTKALSDENEDVCEQIASLTLQQECKNSLAAEEAISQLSKDKCLTITEEAAQNVCLISVSAEIAVQSGSMNKCAEAPDVSRCEKIFLRDMALLKNDAAYCDQLDEETKQLCYDAIGVTP